MKSRSKVKMPKEEGAANSADPEVFICDCVQCEWFGPIDDTWSDVETGEMQCPKCKQAVEIR
jgi:hypothetical protein